MLSWRDDKIPTKKEAIDAAGIDRESLFVIEIRNRSEYDDNPFVVGDISDLVFLTFEGDVRRWMEIPHPYREATESREGAER